MKIIISDDLRNHLKNNKNKKLTKIFIKNKKFFYKNPYKKKYLHFIKNIKNKILIKKNIKKKYSFKKNLKNKILSFKKEKKEYIVKFCVFAGREKNLKILHSYIELMFVNNIIDEYHIFDFSRNNNDHNFIMIEYERLNKLFINKIFLNNFNENEKILKEPRKKTNWSPFYTKISKETENNDIIIKCDDDILFIDIYSLKNAILDRINDKESFLIHSNCINNGVCAYYQSNLFHKIENEINKYPKGGILGVLFEKPEIAYAMHNQFTIDLLNDINNLNKYIIDDMYINSRISINFILINGVDTKYFNDITFDDEYELSSLIPEKLCRYNKIKGDLITSHLSYSFQDKIMLNRDNILNNYNKIKDKYICLTETCIINYNLFKESLLKSHVNNDIYTVKNWIENNHFYIKNIETNKYLYIDYDNDELILSDNNKITFEINKKLNKDIIEIKLGIYNLTRYNIIGKFRNENMLFKYFKDNSEKEILMEDIDDNKTFYIKFPKYNMYLSVNSKNTELIDVNTHKTNKWIFEKNNSIEKYIDVVRYCKNKKFYYKNINTNEIYTNYYLGWGLEGILW